ncbi:MAG: hypothetical protein CL949_00655 [Erythrobacter sp.]|nr:hypothetical protein [Erythrobacter sp.]|tara:strand:+ start:2107 stop:2457 length:351 start_codon:yes stop_codon:yes gene_type:complete
MASIFSRQSEAPKDRIDFGFILYWYLHLFGFALSCLLITWGLFLLFILAIGGFSIDGMMHQLNNLASRYVAAGPDRIASFKHIVFGAQMLLAVVVIVLRRHLIIPRRLNEGNQHHG